MTAGLSRITLAALLTLVASGTTAPAEDIQDYLAELGEADAPVFSSRDHPKSPGLALEIKYPKSWRAEEGKRPNILQKFQSKDGQGLINVLINVVQLPPEAGDGREVAEELKYLNEEDATAMLPAGAKLLKLERTKLDNEPCTIMEFAHTASHAGLDMEMRGLQFCTVIGQHMFAMTGMVTKSAQLDPEQFDRQWEQVKLLIKAIAGSVYFPDKWKPEGLRDKTTADAQQSTAAGVRHASKEFGFAATFPDKVEPLVLPYKMGRMGTFQALDTNNNLIVMVTANFMPASGLLVAAKESTPKQLIAAMVEKNAEEKSALAGSLKTSWGTLHGKPALDFSYTTDSFAPEGVRTYHFGRSSFDVDTFYHLQVVAFEENSKAREELDRLAQGFTFSAE